MYTITVKNTRPSVETPFFSPTDDLDFKTHWINQYKETGKLIFLSQELSTDSLTQTTLFLWQDKASYDEAMADPIVASKWALRKEYNITNGIILVDRTEENI